MALNIYKVFIVFQRDPLLLILSACFRNVLTVAGGSPSISSIVFEAIAKIQYHNYLLMKRK